VDALQPQLGNRVAFVVADLSTPQGQAFAQLYGVGETTLVFLDANGRALNVHRGVTNQAHLRSVIQATFGY
jgi:hypothetical protein